MKDKTSVSHDDVMVKKLRQRPAFAAEYLRAAMGETDDPEVLLIAVGLKLTVEMAHPAR